MTNDEELYLPARKDYLGMFGVFGPLAICFALVIWACFQVGCATSQAYDGPRATYPIFEGIRYQDGYKFARVTNPTDSKLHVELECLYTRGVDLPPRSYADLPVWPEEKGSVCRIWSWDPVK